MNRSSVHLGPSETASIADAANVLARLSYHDLVAVATGMRADADDVSLWARSVLGAEESQA